MTRGSSEVKELVNEVKQGFGALATEHRKRQAQLYRHQTYEDELIANLDPAITVRIPMSSEIPSTDAKAIVGIINGSYSWHIEPKGDKTDRARTSADHLELYFAGLWSGPFKPVIEPTLRDQTASPFGLWWLEWEQFALPAEAAKREAYRKGYRPFRLMRIDPLTGFFLPDDNGKPTVAVREFEQPYAVIAKLYGKRKDDSPLRILNEQFPGLRGASGRALDASDNLTTRRAKVCVVDDGMTIAHYVTGIAGTKNTYEEASGEVPNPWSRSSLFVIPGQYNADAERLVDMYRPINHEELGEQRKLDVMRTHMASLAFTANKFGQSLDKEIVAMLTAEDKPTPSVEMKDGFFTLRGAPAEFSLQPGESAKELLLNQIAERDKTRPPPFLTNPDESLIKNATATAQVNAHETSNRVYDQARGALIQQMAEVDKAIKHFMTGGYLNKTPGDEKLYYNPTGRESASSVYAGNYKDKEIELSDEDFGLDYDEEITIVATTQSQKALQFELVGAQVDRQVATLDDLMGVVTENVEGKKKEINEFNEYQKLEPMVDNLILLNSLMTINAESNINLIPLALSTGLLDPALVGGGQDAGIGGTRLDPSATATPPVAGTV